MQNPHNIFTEKISIHNNIINIMRFVKQIFKRIKTDGKFSVNRILIFCKNAKFYNIRNYISLNGLSPGEFNVHINRQLTQRFYPPRE